VGSLEGTRDYTVHPVRAPEDWRSLRPLDPSQGAQGAQLRCLRLIADELAGEVPFIQTIFSPLAQAKNLVGRDRLPVHLRRYPDALRAGLDTITETTVRFVTAALETGISGVFYAVQHAQYGLFTEQEYAAFGRPYDLRILEATQGLWLNVLHLHGTEVMFDLLADYPVQVFNWHDRETSPTLAEAQRRVAGAVCGGLQRWDGIVRGTPDQVHDQAADAIAQTGGRRLILGTGCVTPIIAPMSNIRAARASVEVVGT
jgi:uroporphyrinogen decarboxylase